MSTLNKVHEYKDYKFNIKVELDYQVERSLDGKREHNITLNDMGPSNYYQTHLAETHNLQEIIELMIEDAEKWVYEKINEGKPQAQRILEYLGFK
jgi:hypothetical protein